MASISTAKAFKRRDEIIVDLLGTIQRHRELNEDERALFERTVRRITPKREVWRWSEREDRMLLTIIKQRPVEARYLGYGRPFKRNDLIRQIAAELGRTEYAVYRRMERLRKQSKCSDVSAKRKG